ncbi:MAG: hypothetical protein R2748_00170 [Bryobacterales bacterium]
MAATFFNFRRRTTSVLTALLFFAVLAFGATDPWAFAVVACTVFLLAAAWTARILRHPYQTAFSWFYVPLAVVAVVGLIQMTLDRTASRYRTAGELGWWLVYCAFFALLLNVLSDISLRRDVQRRLAYLGGLVSVVAIAQWVFSPQAAYGFRRAPGADIFGPFVDVENFAFLVELVFPSALLLAFRDSERKLSLFASCTAMVAAVGVSGSLVGQGLLALEFVITLLAATYLAARTMSRRTWRPQALLTALGATAIAVVLFVGLSADVRERLTQGFEPVDTPGVFVLTRGDVLRTSWQLFQQQPALGHGLGAFGPAFSSAVPRQDGFHWEHGHTDPVELAVEIGLAGILAQALMLALILVAARGRDLRAWVGLVLPLTVAWGHSWIRSPLRIPALVLVALTVLALLAARSDSGARTASQA